jgi:DNA-binding transcriptional ArsR family regulator
VKVSNLDEHCKGIFGLLAVSTDPLRFTKLYKELNARGFKISRPTLVKHLNHLQENEIVTRKEEGKQNTSYSVNWSKLNYLKFYAKYRKAVKKIRTDKKVFDSFTMEEKVTYVTLMLSLLEVTRLKFEILSFLEPKRRFEANITFLFAESTFEPFRMWLLQSCLKSKEDAQKTLANVEELERRIQNELFDKK